MTIDEYIQSLKDKRVAVIGIGVSNEPLIRLLLENGVEVTARDRAEREGLGGAALALEKLGARLVLGGNYLESLTEDVIFRTPG
jgi:UDP-N-acetylmuramoylalanine--D-glutamate ligase